MNLVGYLNTPPKSVFWLILKATALCLAWNFAGTVICIIFEVVTGAPLVPDWLGLDEMSDAKAIVFVIVLLILAPLNSILEELLFRAPWLTITGKLFPRSGATVIVAVISSIIFGWVHGGVATIPLQGVTGMALSFCYLKCGGQDGKFWKPYLVAVVIHTLINFAIFGVGGTMMILGMALE